MPSYFKWRSSVKCACWSVHSVCYNRIVVHGEAFAREIVPQSAKPFNFQTEYGLTEEQVGCLRLCATDWTKTVKYAKTPNKTQILFSGCVLRFANFFFCCFCSGAGGQWPLSSGGPAEGRRVNSLHQWCHFFGINWHKRDCKSEHVSKEVIFFVYPQPSCLPSVNMVVLLK